MPPPVPISASSGARSAVARRSLTGISFRFTLGLRCGGCGDDWPVFSGMWTSGSRARTSRAGPGVWGGLVLRLSRAPALCCKRRGSQSELAGGLNGSTLVSMAPTPRGRGPPYFEARRMDGSGDCSCRRRKSS